MAWVAGAAWAAWAAWVEWAERAEGASYPRPAPSRAGPVRRRGLSAVGPLLQGIGLNVTVWSYADRLGFCWLSHADLPRGLHDLADRAPRQLDMLGAGTSSALPDR